MTGKDLLRSKEWKKLTQTDKALLLAIILLSGEETTVSSLADLAGIPRPTCYHSLHKLVRLNIVMDSTLTRPGQRPDAYRYTANIEVPISRKASIDTNRTRNGRGTDTERTPALTNDKKKYADFVYMKESDYQKLVEKYGQKATEKMIEVLDAYKGSTGRRYKDDYRAILMWVVDKVKKDHPDLFDTKKQQYKRDKDGALIMPDGTKIFDHVYQQMQEQKSKQSQSKEIDEW